MRGSAGEDAAGRPFCRPLPGSAARWQSIAAIDPILAGGRIRPNLLQTEVGGAGTERAISSQRSGKARRSWLLTADG